MPIDDSDIARSGHFGYAPICQDATNAVYALYPADSDGNPVTKGSGFVNGSAFAVSPDGLFLTASHVLSKIRTTLADKDYQLGLARDVRFGNDERVLVGANVVQEYKKDLQDIAVLSCDVSPLDSFEHLVVRTQGPVESMGQPVATFGYPINAKGEEGWNILQRTFSGVVSSVSTFNSFPTYEVDALFNPGLSGGPLLSLRKGDVIGIVHGTKWHTQSFNGQGVPYPAHISKAKIVTELDAFDTSIGRELEEFGVDSRHEPE